MHCGVARLPALAILLAKSRPSSIRYRSRHVHGFLQEIGQGIQHVASRVEDLVAFVQQANDIREITGEVRCALDCCTFSCLFGRQQ